MMSELCEMQSEADALGVAATTASDLASPPLFHKQRKRRKERKESIPMATSNQTDCCVNRFSYNAASTCLNCAPSACVYCHFDELANRDRYSVKYLTEPSTRRNDLYEFHLKNSVPINFWPGNQCENINFKRQRNVGLNRRTEQLQRFAIYENLCEFCGYAIGNGAYHLECDANIRNQTQIPLKTENIYENICEACHSVFDDKCTSEICMRKQKATTFETQPVKCGEVIDVLVKKPPTNRQFGKQFSGFLGSFKQKLTPKTDNPRKRPTIEIVHNTGDVFKTNTTFNLNEIVALRNESLSGNNEGLVNDNLVNEIANRTSQPNSMLSCELGENFNQAVQSKGIRLFQSDSNFLTNTQLAACQQSPLYESIVSDTVLYSHSHAPPSYEDAILCAYASVNPSNLRARVKPQICDSTSASSFFTNNSPSASQRQSRVVLSLDTLFDDPVKHWLLSLRRQTFEYSDNYSQFACDSIKCLPSKMIDESVTQMRRSIDHNSNGANNSNGLNDSRRLQRRIQLFKDDLMEHRVHSKRNAIYIKDSVRDVFADAALPPDVAGTDIEMTSNSSIRASNASESELYQNLINFGYDSNGNAEETRAGVENIENTVSRYDEPIDRLPQSSTISLEPISITVALEVTSQYLQMLKTFYMAQVSLSTSLNRITLVCGDTRVHFLVKLLVNQSQLPLTASNALTRPTRYTNLLEIIELIHENALNAGRGKRTHSMEDKCFSIHSIHQLLDTTLRSRQNHLQTHYSEIEAGNDVHKSNTLADAPDNVSDCASQEHNIDHDTDVQNEVSNASEVKQNIYSSIEAVDSPVEMAFDEESLNNFATCENKSDELATHDANEREEEQKELLFSSQHRSADESVYEHQDDTRPTKPADNTQKQLFKANSANVLNDKADSYRTICVLYSKDMPNRNEIIYDYNGNLIRFTEDASTHDTHHERKRSTACDDRKTLNEFHKQSRNTSQECETSILSASNNRSRVVNKRKIFQMDSINAWKSMLRSVDYNDDEEDVVSLDTRHLSVSK